ncbi:helix-turn-helix transcriptional regulator [Methylobacillus gramineus]|uniref:winged helix-turn-helix transcriptional regulator n=1 Tax=Methylobacillus gramineus TaxID=755169 RepID=UPI001D0004E2|nr:helix-turn-helix domain-containing protein [Methylobacillus gramineus]MCB5185890.1 helix-turn-helix transcriptional regulator [Methylobacillus gramineus]
MRSELKDTDNSSLQSHKNCAFRDLLSRLGDKWSMLVMVSLAKADNHCLRFSELSREVNGISQRMLSTTLRQFERDGIVTRHLYPEVPPRVEYTLTDRGREFLVPVQALVDWMVSEWPKIEVSRLEYDSKHQALDPSGREAI